MLNIRNHPRYKGSFTRSEAPEAKFKNGARVRKMLFEHGDGHALDTLGTVLGSIHERTIGTAYFVEFDPDPNIAVLVIEEKIGAA